MATNNSPISKVRSEYGGTEDRGKAKLVDKVAGLIGGDEDGDTLRERLMKVSNKKLMRLAEVGGTIKAKYGSTDKVAEAVAEAAGRAKDSDYVAQLKAYSPGRLLDMAQALTRRAAQAAQAAKASVKPAEGVVTKAAKAAVGAAEKVAKKATRKATSTVAKAAKTAEGAVKKVSKATKSKK